MSDLLPEFYAAVVVFSIVGGEIVWQIIKWRSGR